MSATTTPTAVDQARRAGALAGMEALREFCAAIKASRRLNGSEFVVMRTKLCHELAAELGVTDPVHQGGVMVLAEYIYESIDGCPPGNDFQDWTPTATMTEESLAQEIASMEADIDADKAYAAEMQARKVVSIASRRPVQ